MTRFPGLQRLLILTLVLGLWFRFSHLDRKVFWNDEAYTALRISGYSELELVKQVYTGTVIQAGDLRTYQFPNPNRSPLDTLLGLAFEEPQHPPLYFLLLQGWVKLWGASIGVIRSFSAVLSVLMLPLIYLLCQALFESSLTGWIAMALVAISPFQVLYAQEARQYSLWGALTLLSCWLFIRALEQPNRWRWGLYAGATIVSLYSFLLSGLVWLAQGLTVGLREGGRLTQIVLGYLISSVMALAAFLPWLALLVSNLLQARDRTSWAERHVGLLELLQLWGLNLGRIFLDLQPDGTVLPSLLHLTMLDPILKFGVLVSLVVLVGYALYYLWRTTPQTTWLLVFSLIGSSVLSLVIPDLFLGGVRSGTTRYLVPAILGIQLGVAHLLSTHLSTAHSRVQRWLWSGVLALLLLGGVASLATSDQSRIWWNKWLTTTQAVPQVAALINQTPNPLIVSDTFPGAILGLSHLLNSHVHLQLVLVQDQPQIPPGFNPILLYRPTPILLQQLLQKPGCQLQPLIQAVDRVWLWRVGLACTHQPPSQ